MGEKSLKWFDFPKFKWLNKLYLCLILDFYWTDFSQVQSCSVELVKLIVNKIVLSMDTQVSCDFNNLGQ